MTWAEVGDALRTGLAAVMSVTAVPVIVYFVLINSSLLALIALAYADFRSQQRRRTVAVDWQDGGLAPGISLLVPAYNEETGIVTAVKSFLTLRYPSHEVIVIDDGSTDATFERLREAFDLVEVPRELPDDVPVRARVLSVHLPRDGRTRLVVVRKDNSGRRMRYERRDYRVAFVPEPVSWTEVPSTIRVLRHQRRRWHRGLWETLWAYRGMLCRPRYGRVGALALPHYWLFELVAPLIELFGLVVVPLALVLGVVDVPWALTFVLLAYGYAVLLTLAALLVDEWAFHRHDRWRGIWITLIAAVLENVGYRQLTVWWRLEGWWASLRGRAPVWGVMTRTGFDDEGRP